MHIITDESRGFVLSNLPPTASRLISIAGHVLTTHRFHGFYTWKSQLFITWSCFFLSADSLSLFSKAYLSVKNLDFIILVIHFPPNIIINYDNVFIVIIIIYFNIFLNNVCNRISISVINNCVEIIIIVTYK